MNYCRLFKNILGTYINILYILIIYKTEDNSIFYEFGHVL